MNEAIIEKLRSAGVGSTPVELADLLGSLLPGGLSEGAFVTYLHVTFPEMPIRYLMEATEWHRFRKEGGLSDAEVSTLLEPHLPWRGRD